MAHSIVTRACAHVLDAASSWIARHCRARAARIAKATLERAYLRASNLNVMDARTNGEFALLDCLSGRLPFRSVFDVGANVGDWTTAAAHAFPAATVHAFEPSPHTFVTLTERLAERGLVAPRVVAVPLALAESKGRRSLYEYASSDLASFTDWHGRAMYTTVVEADAGAAFAEGLGIEQVDFLKIDVEGYEMDVLQGFAPWVRTGRLGFVQFEYGIFALERRIHLRDFYDYFGSGYRIGRIMPANVAFGDYDWRLETPYFANYLAARVDLLGVLGE